MILLTCLILSFCEGLFANILEGFKMEPDKRFNKDNFAVDHPTFEIREPAGFIVTFNGIFCYNKLYLIRLCVR